ncbi:MAG: hypothetical protein ACTHWH_13845 [Marinobacter sp.]
MATVTISANITLPMDATSAEIFAVNLVYGFPSPQNCLYVGYSSGGAFSETIDGSQIHEPFWLIFEFYGDAEPAIAGPYNYDGSPAAGGP